MVLYGLYERNVYCWHPGFHLYWTGYSVSFINYVSSCLYSRGKRINLKVFHSRSGCPSLPSLQSVTTDCRRLEEQGASTTIHSLETGVGRDGVREFQRGILSRGQSGKETSKWRTTFSSVRSLDTRKGPLLLVSVLSWVMPPSLVFGYLKVLCFNMSHFVQSVGTFFLRVTFCGKGVNF